MDLRGLSSRLVRPYGSSTTTLKNLNAALFSSVTVCHSPPSTDAPMMTARASGTFHSLCAEIREDNPHAYGKRRERHIPHGLCQDCVTPANS